ncbi:ccr4 associated factor [Myotisia sp. PD_48]|nr:ccr4 associated factor [Myotisia sp. PD_48]
MLPNFPSNWLCRHCLLQTRRLSSTWQPPPPSPLPPQQGYSRLTNRSLISVTGADSTTFLQGLITQNIVKPKDRPRHTPFYTAFLNAKGRVFHDVFIYPSVARSNWPDDWDYLIEVDKEEVTDLMRHLKRHKLRSKLEFRKLKECERSVWAIWDGRKTPTWNCESVEKRAKYNIDGTIFTTVDNRAPGLGYRFVGFGDTISRPLQEFLPGDEVPLTTYTLRRFLHGVAEGQTEIRRAAALPGDSNIDIMNGIDFHKGCYLGQELTIRTHHRGIIRKRILPVQLYRADEPMPTSDLLTYRQDADFSLPGAWREVDVVKVGDTKRSVGKFLVGMGNVGLAVCRLESMTDMSVTGEPTAYNPDQEFMISWEPVRGQGAVEVRLKAVVPPWIREYVLSGGARHRLPQSKAPEAREPAEEL